MSNDAINIKLVVCGPFGAGKTQLISTISDIKMFSTEVKIGEETLPGKKTTTVAMDYGKYQLDIKTTVHLFGTPGQKRFRFMHEILGVGAKGILLVVDSTLVGPDQKELLNYLQCLTEKNVRPILVCANKQDLPGAQSPERVRKILGISRDIQIIPTTLTQKTSAVEAVEEIVKEIH